MYRLANNIPIVDDISGYYDLCPYVKNCRPMSSDDVALDSSALLIIEIAAFFARSSSTWPIDLNVVKI